VSEKNYITPSGYKRLVDELTELATVERPRVVREVSDAAAEGDRSENAAYIYGKRRLREIDRRMGFLQRRLKDVAVVKPEEARRDRIFFGAWVEVEDDEGETHRYQIVGVDEVEADKGRISWKSPVGRALLGKKLDDSVMVRWHAGQRELTIVGIDYDAAPSAEAMAATEKARATKPKTATATAKAKPPSAGTNASARTKVNAKSSAKSSAKSKARAKS
jgi:transcription elongation factor GreB